MVTHFSHFEKLFTIITPINVYLFKIIIHSSGPISTRMCHSSLRDRQCNRNKITYVCYQGTQRTTFHNISDVNTKEGALILNTDNIRHTILYIGNQ